MPSCKNCGFTSDEPTSNSVEDLVACDPRVQLQELDFQIARARTLIKELRRKRIPLKRKINRFHSPVLRLPPELYSEIFTACLPEISWSALGENVTVPYSNMPLLIGMVCSAWRELAWSMPQLWSRISISLDMSSPESRDLTQEWITRSGQSPLSIHLVCTLNPDQIYLDSSILSTLDIIAGCSHHWSKIYFAFPVVCYQAIGRIRNRLPLLSFMSLRLNRLPWFTPFDGFDNAPQLSHIEIEGYEQDSLNLSLVQVTKLSLAWITTEECQELLKRCPNLSHCSFLDLVPSEGSWSPTLSPQIEYLDIQVEIHHAPGALAELLDSLIIPAARELRIDNAGFDFPLRKFLSLLSRSGCSLQRLALVNCPCSERGLIRCLAAIPSLVHLEFSVLGLMNSVVYALDHSDPSNVGYPCLLPNLKTLVLGSHKVGLLGLVSMLSARWRTDDTYAAAGDHYNAATQLRSVVVTHPNDLVPDSAVLAQLRRLVMEGMEISLTTGSGPSTRTWL